MRSMSMERTRAGRMAILAIVNWIILQVATLLAALLGFGPGTQPFFYLLVIGMAAKLVGDALYFTVSPERRRWRYLVCSLKQMLTTALA